MLASLFWLRLWSDIYRVSTVMFVWSAGVTCPHSTFTHCIQCSLYTVTTFLYYTNQVVYIIKTVYFLWGKNCFLNFLSCYPIAYSLHKDFIIIRNLLILQIKNESSFQLVYEKKCPFHLWQPFCASQNFFATVCVLKCYNCSMAWYGAETCTLLGKNGEDQLDQVHEKWRGISYT